jgi:hypothetical protein
LQKAVLQVENAVSRARHVQPQGAAVDIGGLFRGAVFRSQPGPGGKGEFHFIAVILLLGRRNRRQDNPGHESRQVLEALLDMASLPVQLLCVGDILPLAAAAQAEMRTERRLIRGGLRQDLDHPGLGEVRFFAGNLDAHLLAGDGMLHEDHKTRHPAQGLAAEGQLFYGQLQFHSLVHRGAGELFFYRGHAERPSG